MHSEQRLGTFDKKMICHGDLKGVKSFINISYPKNKTAHFAGRTTTSSTYNTTKRIQAIHESRAGSQILDFQRS
jgi:hypothetical protein